MSPPTAPAPSLYHIASYLHCRDGSPPCFRKEQQQQHTRESVRNKPTSRGGWRSPAAPGAVAGKSDGGWIWQEEGRKQLHTETTGCKHQLPPFNLPVPLLFQNEEWDWIEDKEMAPDPWGSSQHPMSPTRTHPGSITRPMAKHPISCSYSTTTCHFALGTKALPLPLYFSSTFIKIPTKNPI